MVATVRLIMATLTVFVTIVRGISPSPSIGDIRLEPIPDLPNYYEVLVYYTDRIEVPNYGGICSSNHGGVGSVVCRQLGYNYIRSTQRPTDHPMWFTNVSCDYHDFHILRCQHTVLSGSERHTCTYSLLVQCDFNRSWYEDYYEGQVALCPSDNQTNTNARTSISFGLISLHFNGMWRSLHAMNNTFLHRYEADTICKQMGFTGAIADSAVAVTASKFTFEKCYTRTQPFTLEPGAWLATTDIECLGPQECLRCCCNYPSNYQCPNCGYDMVIQCTFEPSEAKFVQGTVSRSSRDCEFKDENRAAEYNQEQPSPCKQYLDFHEHEVITTGDGGYQTYVKQQSTIIGLSIGLGVSILLIVAITGVAMRIHHRANDNPNRRDYIAIDNHNHHNQGAPDNLLHNNNLAPVGI